MRRWFDAHLDLAYLALGGRDLGSHISEAGGRFLPASVTFSSLKEGGVSWALATIFTAMGPEEPWRYKDSDDLEGAHRVGRAQLEIYEKWEEQGLVSIARSAADLASDRELNLIMLMEGCDPIRNPDEVPWWFDRGLRVAGMSWFDGSRYSGGNRRQGPLTSLGRDLVSAFDELGIVHDLSHLSDESANDLLSATARPVIASHSNSRSIVGTDDQRHLSDELIAEIGKREGVIGLNLCGKFITSGESRATIDEAIDHIEHCTSLTQTRTSVGLGSDMDGGFSAEGLPEEMTCPADLEKIAAALLERGWSEEEVDGFAFDNWMRFFERALSETGVSA